MVPKKDEEKIFLSQGMVAMLHNRKKPNEIRNSLQRQFVRHESHTVTPPPQRTTRHNQGLKGKRDKGGVRGEETGAAAQVVWVQGATKGTSYT